MRAVADITWPGVQYPHWNASCSRKARCTGCNSPSAANPSIVVTSASATVTASVMQASTRRPATCTVQAPHSPRSQPIFVPVSPNRSRKASSSVTRGSSTMTCALPLTRNVISRSSSNLTPQMYLPVCPAAQISAHFAEIYGASVIPDRAGEVPGFAVRQLQHVADGDAGDHAALGGDDHGGAAQREAHGLGGHVRVGVAERLEAGEAPGVAGAGQAAGQCPFAGPAGDQAGKRGTDEVAGRPTRPGPRTARLPATAIPGRARAARRSAPVSSSLPPRRRRWPSTAAARSGPAGRDSQSRNHFRARLRRSWLPSLSRTNIPLVSRSKASSRSCLVAGQSAAAGRGGNDVRADSRRALDGRAAIPGNGTVPVMTGGPRTARPSSRAGSPAPGAGRARCAACRVCSA